VKGSSRAIRYGLTCLGVAVFMEKADGRWGCRAKVEEMLIW
jgi:hypothetical protein